jgi:hypothetical protein
MSWNRRFDSVISCEKRVTLIQRKKTARARDLERFMARRYKYTPLPVEQEQLEVFMFSGTIQEVENG